MAAQNQGLTPDILIVPNQDIAILVADKLLAPASATGLAGTGEGTYGTYGTPRGGDTITIPVQQDTKRYAIDDKIIACVQSSAVEGRGLLVNGQPK